MAEIPNAPKEWSYTGPLLGIVFVTLLAGEIMLWRMSHPRKPQRSTVATAPPPAAGVSEQPS